MLPETQTPEIRQDVMDMRRDLTPALLRNRELLSADMATFEAQWKVYVLGRMSPFGWKIGLLEAADFARKPGAITPELEAALWTVLTSLDEFQAILDAEIARVRP